MFHCFDHEIVHEGMKEEISQQRGTVGAHWYTNNLKEVNRTCLKSCILSHFPGKLQEQSDGKTVLLVFNEGMASIFREELWKHDFESDALTLAKAARIVRHAMFNQPGFHFLGSFPECRTFRQRVISPFVSSQTCWVILQT